MSPPWGTDPTAHRTMSGLYVGNVLALTISKERNVAISHSNQCSTTGASKVVVCAILSVGWCI